MKKIFKYKKNLITCILLLNLSKNKETLSHLSI